MSDYVVFDPKVANGAPFFKGTQISVAEVLQRLASGQSRESTIQAYGGQIKTVRRTTLSRRRALSPSFKRRALLGIG